MTRWIGVINTRLSTARIAAPGSLLLPIFRTIGPRQQWPVFACAVCQAEYDDPLNRRFHAQPPRVRWAAAGWNTPGNALKDVLGAAQALLVSGHIVAVKGLGGFHLVCRTREGLLVQLRERKGRWINHLL